MERQRIFIDDILSNENMNRAYKQVIKNKGAAGIDGMECNDLLSHLKVNGHQLRESIRNQSYKPMPVKRVEIPKDNGSKRKLGIPTVTDRMIQQAAAQVLTPIYERKFHTNSYGFRPGKSAQQAVLKAAEYMNEGYNWVVDIDLEKFFDTVEHDKMISILNKEIKDGKTLSLIRKFLVSGVMVGEQMEETEIGTPNDAPTAQNHADLRGVFYAMSSVAAAFVLSLAVGPLAGKMLGSMFWFFEYRFTVLPVLLTIPVFLLLGWLIPCMMYDNAAKCSIVDQLRDAQ